MTYNDPESLELFSIRYRATDEQANRALLRLMDLDVYREYLQIDITLQYVRLNLAESANLTRRWVELRIALAKESQRITDEELHRPEIPDGL